MYLISLPLFLQSSSVKELSVSSKFQNEKDQSENESHGRRKASGRVPQVFLLRVALEVLDPVLRALLDHGAGGGPAVDRFVASLGVEVLALVRVAEVALESVEFQAVGIVGDAAVVVAAVDGAGRWEIYVGLGLWMSQAGSNQGCCQE